MGALHTVHCLAAWAFVQLVHSAKKNTLGQKPKLKQPDFSEFLLSMSSINGGEKWLCVVICTHPGQKPNRKH